MERPQVVLASASPRRKQLLQQIRISCVVKVADINESVCETESPSDYVSRIALEKARAVYKKNNFEHDDLPILAADTSVVFQQKILGKPRDRAHAVQMLLNLSNHTHEVLTAVAVKSTKIECVTVSTSRVTLGIIDKAEANAYWLTKEPADKAGGYAIQGLAAIWIKRIEGSFSSIMGLPLYETAQLLKKVGVEARWQDE